ncbi:MAG: nitrous oxide reductase family maturation protein NosD [Candidatus Hermodarchaeota archaeon]
MKKKSKTSIIFLMTLVILFAFSQIITTNLNFKISEFTDSNFIDNENLKLSVVSGKIHIINNWTEARDRGICTGSGSYSDPYVIEDLEIDGEGRGSCILIGNSDVFFQIKHCKFYNASSFCDGMICSTHAGIKLYDVSNAQIVDNDCSYNNDIGIFLWDCNNNAISGNLINNNQYGIGIYLWDSNNNTISGNFLNNNQYGIYISGYSKNTLSGNIMNDCGLKFRVGSHLDQLRSHDIDTTNLVNGKPLYYYSDEVFLGSDDFTNAGQVILLNVNDSTISNLYILRASDGISLYYCNNNTIARNIMDNNFEDGIFLDSSHNNKISMNNLNNNNNGIFLTESNNNEISTNVVKNNNRHGIENWFCDNNSFLDNIVSNNVEKGLALIGENNIIYRNCFIDNGLNALDSGSNNYWDNGTKGNYWSDYPGQDEDNDGIGDIPYIIAGVAGSQDNFPLMKFPLPLRGNGEISFELIILISVTSGGAVIGVATLLLIRRKKNRIK